MHHSKAKRQNIWDKKKIYQRLGGFYAILFSTHWPLSNHNLFQTWQLSGTPTDGFCVLRQSKPKIQNYLQIPGNHGMYMTTCISDAVFFWESVLRTHFHLRCCRTWLVKSENWLTDRGEKLYPLKELPRISGQFGGIRMNHLTGSGDKAILYYLDLVDCPATKISLLKWPQAGNLFAKLHWI